MATRIAGITIAARRAQAARERTLKEADELDRQMERSMCPWGEPREDEDEPRLMATALLIILAVLLWGCLA